MVGEFTKLHKEGIVICVLKGRWAEYRRAYITHRNNFVLKREGVKYVSQAETVILFSFLGVRKNLDVPVLTF